MSQPPSPKNVAEPEPAASVRGEVLVVDDEPEVRQLLLDSLRIASFRCTGAGAAAAALELLRARPFDVMLCDLLMPQMSGVELMVKARLEAPDMAIIVITGVSDVQTAIRSMRVGAYDYVVKPISPADVSLRVSSAMETRRHVLKGRRAQERLQESYGQLKRMSEVKDNLVQMLVHDLKTPLASAMGYMQLLEHKTEESFSERQLRYLQHAYRSCRGVLRMTTTMLDLTRMEHGTLRLHREPLDLPSLLHDAAAEMEPLLAPSGGRVETHCHPGVQPAPADAEMARRILGNLLANAVRHSPPGSTIQLAAEPADGELVVVSVADCGEGIAPEDQERVFEKFCQLGPASHSGGAGIGLAFCKMAVEAHGGTIWVESTPGQGSTFRFSLPGGGPSPVVRPASGTGDPR